LPTDIFVLERAGVGTLKIAGDQLPGGSGGILIESNGLVLQTGTFYGIKSSLGAWTISLPSLSEQAIPSYADLADIDYNINVNNLTIQANGSDLIALYGASASSQTLKVAGVQARLVANTTSWRLLVSTG
jgi:hypothetical protein